MDDEEYKKEKRINKRRNYIQRDLRDLRGPFSLKMISSKKEAYRREKTIKDFNIDNEDE